jgi:hypothetical protein
MEEAGELTTDGGPGMKRQRVLRLLGVTPEHPSSGEDPESLGSTVFDPEPPTEPDA